MDLKNLRRSYASSALNREQLADDPMDQFKKWFDEALQASSAEWYEPYAMTLATAAKHGTPSARIVLLKSFGPSGFTFFTNYESAKAADLADNPVASLLFYWPHVERQIRIQGKVEKTDSQTSDRYFHERPRGSQIGAAVSQQSRPLASRQELELQVQQFENEIADAEVPRPEFWGGYLLSPVNIEFWQGRPNRLHDRFVYQQQQSGWDITRLAP